MVGSFVCLTVGANAFFVLFWVWSFGRAQIKLLNDFPDSTFGRSVPYFPFFFFQCSGTTFVFLGFSELTTRFLGK